MTGTTEDAEGGADRATVVRGRRQTVAFSLQAPSAYRLEWAGPPAHSAYPSASLGLVELGLGFLDVLLGLGQL
ncbi:MAG: hypothetical protein KC731_32485, partial [Myxococcales bacterium]|nr:hypothetical protein [Myxococcales bacterium]